jgi:hypothetical protein
MVPLSVLSIDGTYVNCSGGVASQPYRITLRYVSQQVGWATT